MKGGRFPKQFKIRGKRKTTKTNHLSRITWDELKLLINHRKITQEGNQINLPTRTYTKKFENADLNQFLQKDPDKRLYEKFIKDVKGMGVCAKRDNQQEEFFAFYWGKAITEDELCRMLAAGKAKYDGIAR